MRRTLSFWMFVAGSIPAGAFGAQLSVRDTVGDIHSVEIDLDAAPSGSITVNIRLDIDPNDEVNGLTFVLKSFDNLENTNPAFWITGRTVIGFPMTNGGTLSDETTSNADLTAGPANLLDPTNDRDIGLTGPTGTKVVGSGTIMLLTLSYNRPAPRDYRINIGPDAVTNDNAFVDHDLPAGQHYVVHVVPEPGGAVLLMTGLLAFRFAPRSASMKK